MWIIGHDPNGWVIQGNVAVNLSKAEALFLDWEKVYDDNDKPTDYCIVKVIVDTSNFDPNVTDDKEKTEIELAEFTDGKEAEKFLVDLVEKLNAEQSGGKIHVETQL